MQSKKAFGGEKGVSSLVSLIFFWYTNDELVGLGFFYLHDSCTYFKIDKITEK